MTPLIFESQIFEIDSQGYATECWKDVELRLKKFTEELDEQKTKFVIALG